ncbi:MAG: amidohydrolase family protein [Ilumatobacteraceae bacterium]
MSTGASAAPGTPSWYDLVREDVVDPDLPIIDPHHHLWPDGEGMHYGIADLRRDAHDGHLVEQTVFVECRAAYRADGDPELAPVGETEFVAAEAEHDPDQLIAGIVAHADLRSDRLDEVLDAHVAAGRGRFRGIRHALSCAMHPETLKIPGRAPKDLHLDPAFRRGVARLGERGLTYDTWHYHHQNRDFLELARAVPGTTMVLDHFGTPLGVGPFAGRRDEIFESWAADIAEIARCEHVVAKLGGLAMPDNGFGWHAAERPATSDEVVAAQSRYYLHTIECFGPERCMFESNFPVDRLSLGARTVWNAFKKMTAGFDPAERAQMFAGTARRVYRLG